jgi:hypothetical protein
MAIYGVTSVLAGGGVVYVMATRKWKNQSLLLLAVTVLVMSVGVVVSQAMLISGKDLNYVLLSAVIQFADDFGHWVVCYMYLLVIIEVAALLDRRIY